MEYPGQLSRLPPNLISHFLLTWLSNFQTYMLMVPIHIFESGMWHMIQTVLFLTITPLPAQISAYNFHDLTQITQRRVTLEENRAVKAHSVRGGRGVNRKHHPAERCNLRFGSKRTENFSKRTENLKSHRALRKNLCAI